MSLLYLILAAYSLVLAKQAYGNETPNPGIVGTEICMEDLGCFKLSLDFFHALFRPINFLPENRNTVGTEFHLYTKKFPKEHQLLKHDNSSTWTALDTSFKTVFIVHGFEDFNDHAINEKWMFDIKDELLLKDDYNVIIVNWKKGNTFPYTKATANTRVVGAEIALLINTLAEKNGLDPMNVHIVGHSLGSHIAGYAGERINKLGRITGLDPAAPFFQFMPPSVRLDPTDADLVDVIHTDSFAIGRLALGMEQACGHVDFYPNNGQRQPECSDEAVKSIAIEGLIDGVANYVTCNHVRALDLFMYSINNKLPPLVGYECDSWQKFLEGQCAVYNDNTSAIMGINADKFRPHKNDFQSKKMYLATGSFAPFWAFSYHISIKIRNPKILVSQKYYGSINITVDGSENKYQVVLHNKEVGKDATYIHVVHEGKILGEIKGVSVSWTSKSRSVLFKQEMLVENIVIKPMNIADAGEQKKQTKKYCNKGLKHLKDKAIMKLTAC